MRFLRKLQGSAEDHIAGGIHERGCRRPEVSIPYATSQPMAACTLKASRPFGKRLKALCQTAAHCNLRREFFHLRETTDLSTPAMQFLLKYFANANRQVMVS